MSLTPRAFCTNLCKIVVGYALAAILWIFFGDWLIFSVWPEKASIMNLSLAKGLGFVVFTSVMLYLLLRRYSRLLLKAQLNKTANKLLPVSIDKIFSSTPVIVYAIEFRDGMKHAIWVSNNIKTILGYSAEEALTDGWWEKHLHPEDRQQAVQKSGQIMSGEGGDHEYRFRRTDGGFLYVKDELSLVEETAHGKTFIGVWTDLSKDYKARLAIEDFSGRIEKAMYSSIKVIARLTELRDPYTAGHEARVGELAAAIAGEMGYDDHMQQGLRVAGLLHDVGKIGIPSEILTKPSRLSNVEYELVKTHAENSYLLLSDIEFPWPIAAVAYQHHERIDGSGYPRGLKGDKIILEARILAIADVIESMASHRPYRPALGTEIALQEIEKHAGTHYDTDCAKACLRLFREKNYQMPIEELDPTFLKIEEFRSRQRSAGRQ